MGFFWRTSFLLCSDTLVVLHECEIPNFRSMDGRESYYRYLKNPLAKMRGRILIDRVTSYRWCQWQDTSVPNVTNAMSYSMRCWVPGENNEHEPTISFFFWHEPSQRLPLKRWLLNPILMTALSWSRSRNVGRLVVVANGADGDQSTWTSTSIHRKQRKWGEIVLNIVLPLLSSKNIFHSLLIIDHGNISTPRKRALRWATTTDPCPCALP